MSMGSGTSGFTFTSAIARQDAARRDDVRSARRRRRAGPVATRQPMGGGSGRRAASLETGAGGAGSGGTQRIRRGERGWTAGVQRGEGRGTALWRGGQWGPAASGFRQGCDSQKAGAKSRVHLWSRCAKSVWEREGKVISTLRSGKDLIPLWLMCQRMGRALLGGAEKWDKRQQGRIRDTASSTRT